MRTVEVSIAQADLLRLVTDAAEGEGFIIVESGRPLAKVVRLEAGDAPGRQAETPEAAASSRIGFMEGEFDVPDDFKTRHQAEIEEMFYGTKLDTGPTG